MKNNINRERENSLSHDDAKRFYFAKQRQTKKKYRVAKPLKQPHRTCQDDSIEAVLGVLTGGHSDINRRTYEYYPDDPVRSAPAEKSEDTTKLRQMQKAMYIREKLQYEDHIPVGEISNDIEYFNYPRRESVPFDEDFHDDYYLDNRLDVINNGDQISSENDKNETISKDNTEEKSSENDVTKNTEFEDIHSMSADPEMLDRMRKARFIKENLERETKLSAFMEYKFGDDSEQAAEFLSAGITDENHIGNNVTDISLENDMRERRTDNVIHIGEATALSDDVIENIARMIKQKHLSEQIANRRYAFRQAAFEEVGRTAAADEYGNVPEDIYSVVGNRPKAVEADIVTSNNDKEHLRFRSIIDPQSAEYENASAIHEKSKADIKKNILDSAGRISGEIRQAAKTSENSDSVQSVPYNIGMVLAENEGKKIAYQLAKGDDILAEKEQANVRERMSQSKFRFVAPEGHKPKVEKRETIREEQKRKFVKDSEIKREAVRKEAAQKVKEGIFIRANKNDNGGIIKAIFGEKVYSPKSKTVLIAGAAGAVFPVILIVIVAMFVCSLFSWLAPHNESIFNKDSGTYEDVDLDGLEVIEGYISVMQDIYDEEQLKLLADFSKITYDHDETDTHYIQLEDSFDLESIMALAAVRKQRKLSGKDEKLEPSEDIVYHLTREDFEDIIESTFTMQYQIEERECDICEPEEIRETNPDTGEVRVIGTRPRIHKFLVGSGVANFSSLACLSPYYFFDQFITTGTEHYEEDRVLYDFYRNVLQNYFLGTSDEPSHTKVDYRFGTEDRERMEKCAESKGYEVICDHVTKIKEIDEDETGH